MRVSVTWLAIQCSLLEVASMSPVGVRGVEGVGLSSRCRVSVGPLPDYDHRYVRYIAMAVFQTSQSYRLMSQMTDTIQQRWRQFLAAPRSVHACLGGLHVCSRGSAVTVPLTIRRPVTSAQRT